jgi:serine/threonine protein kinase/ABC-type branched-subunit amino acid transport system substrate-binding protein
MQRERFQQIREVFDAALEHDADSRATFVREACNGDDDMEREVGKLLAAHAESADWVDDIHLSNATPGKALSIGDLLGAYEITGILGFGGMGEVYRARDSKLKRDVAIKVLPDAFAADADRLARFQREAEVLASLNHPNIAAIYHFGEFEGRHFLAMELVEGETLTGRLARGPVPLEETLQICRQITDALEAAHEKRIVHRDLKPSNIKITPEGIVKVLDFGMARIHEVEDSQVTSTDQPPVMSESGMILGTAPYMSPEQARGQAADHRSDIWTFGCLLYEMLNGRAAFSGETVSDTLSEILKATPDWNALPAGLPEGVRRLLDRCLQKDRKRRLHDIADARLEIEDAMASPPPALPVKPRAWGRRQWLLTTAGAAAAAGIGFLFGKREGPFASLPDDAEIRIGVFASLTREYHSYGTATRYGFEMATDRVHGLLLGQHRILPISRDDKGDYDEARRVVRELITTWRVSALLGEFQSNLSLGAAEIAQEFGVPMISHDSTNPAVTQKGEYIFRVCFTDEFQGRAMSKFAIGENLKNVAVLRAKDQYAIGLARAFADNLHKYGGSNIPGDVYDEGDTDFTAQLENIKSRKPDAIFIPGYYPEVRLIAKQSKELGLAVPLLGGDGWDSPEILERPAAELDNCYYSNHYFVGDDDPKVAGFVREYRTNYGQRPDSVAALAYDAANVLFDAIGRANSTDREAIRNAIAQTKDFPGVTGNITIDHERNASKPAVILGVKSGKVEWKRTISADEL